MKTSFSCSTLVLLATVGPLSTSYAADITISGEVIKETCEVDVGSARNVQMPKIQVTEIVGGGKAGPTAMDVTLKCAGAAAGGEQVGLEFVNAPHNAEGNLIAAGSANNLAFRIEDEDGAHVKINQRPTRFIEVKDDMDVTLRHTVWYSRNDSAQPVTVGNGAATVQVNAMYP